MEFPPTFLCDAMLGGLARWLRAAGYDAAWYGNSPDADLVDRAEREDCILLSSDGDIFQFRRVQEGAVRALEVPRTLPLEAQLNLVLSQLGLGVLSPRCMACGGPLVEVPKEFVESKVPARTFHWLDHFWECERCRKVFWRGTHWQSIAARLGELTADA